MKIVTLVLLLSMAGCKSSPPILTDVTETEHDHTATTGTDYISALRTETEKRKMHWYIVCIGESFAGNATLISDGENANEYIEEGGKPRWFVNEQTQQETAKALLKAISKPPNMQPRHKPEETEKEYCPPIIGDEY